AGVGLDAAIGRVGEPDQLHQLGGAVRRLVAAAAVEPVLQLEELASGRARVEPHVLKRDADRPPHLLRLPDDVEPPDACGSRRRLGERGENPDAGRLPGAVRSEEAEDLTLTDAQVDPGDGLDRRGVAARWKGLDQLRCLDRVHGRGILSQGTDGCARETAIPGVRGRSVQSWSAYGLPRYARDRAVPSHPRVVPASPAFRA